MTQVYTVQIGVGEIKLQITIIKNIGLIITKKNIFSVAYFRTSPYITFYKAGCLKKDEE
jgi:hypothetical protein